ncbi:glycosyltransferase involved in cell wall biosynthesis [Paenibacillus taihuensis]|uniref:Glycosyltransferase involved in cell wall biosynthesis n=1 Tax=Paenibacillus taihuensis TaxID=1156355 RepID=A0A3D9SJN0_9BACL|nr:glycosyltransferase family 2 protein [Paenibacillus taihuensis]REE90513.1 glycosyltransferase involved in cell wall biosynthesis [Paenibacillus taihuensis]
MKNFTILISTYNGESYIAEQLESILSQTYSNLSIIIRDDGSTDNTMSILKSYHSRYPSKISLYTGGNLGVIRSFLFLLKLADASSDYYCFCDQDDVWLPHKVASALTHLESNTPGVPAMHFTATQMTTSSLDPIKVWPKSISKPPSFFNALIQNIAVGATVTLNKEARNLLCMKQPSTEYILMHDWWAYLCISAFGNVHFDTNPSILYRQHSNNVVGGELSFWDKMKRKWRSYQKHKGTRLLFKQALEFQRLYGEEINHEKSRQLTLFLSERRTIIQRLQYLAQSKLYRQSLIEQMLFKLLILIGYI